MCCGVRVPKSQVSEGGNLLTHESAQLSLFWMATGSLDFVTPGVTVSTLWMKTLLPKESQDLPCSKF